MTDSDELMDAFPGFSTQCHKRTHFEQKYKKEGEIFLSDYHSDSLYFQNLMNTHVATR